MNKLILLFILISLSFSIKKINKQAGFNSESTCNWIKCADVNETCNFSGTKYAFVRFGTPSQWVYTVAKYNVKCDNSSFYEKNSMNENSSCYYLPIKNDDKRFKNCAQENEKCILDENRAALVRFGKGDAEEELDDVDKNDSYHYREFRGREIECSKNLFGSPTTGQDHSCEYVYLDC